jgi:hypothetical protein
MPDQSGGLIHFRVPVPRHQSHGTDRLGDAGVVRLHQDSLGQRHSSDMAIVIKTFHLRNAPGWPSKSLSQSTAENIDLDPDLDPDPERLLWM